MLPIPPSSTLSTPPKNIQTKSEKHQIQFVLPNWKEHGQTPSDQPLKTVRPSLPPNPTASSSHQLRGVTLQHLYQFLRTFNSFLSGLFFFDFCFVLFWGRWLSQKAWFSFSVIESAVIDNTENEAS